MSLHNPFKCAKVQNSLAFVCVFLGVFVLSSVEVSVIFWLGSLYHQVKSWLPRNIIAHLNKPHNHRYPSCEIVTVMLVLASRISHERAMHALCKRYNEYVSRCTGSHSGWVLYSIARYILVYLVTVLHWFGSYYPLSASKHHQYDGITQTSVITAQNHANQLHVKGR